MQTTPSDAITITRREAAGFTLVELMIVVAVIAILAAVAIPSYSEYVKRGARADAQALLMDWSLRQQQFLVDKRRYADTLATLGVSAPPALATKYSLSMSAPAGVVPPTFTITASPTGGQSTEACGTMSITNLGAKTPARCW